MKHIMQRILSVLAILFFFTPAWAAQVKTAVFSPARDNCPAEISAKVESRLRRDLGSVSRIALTAKEDVVKALDGKQCVDSGCAIALCRQMKIERAVTVAISGSSSESARAMGDSGKDQYLLKISDNETYRITVALWESRSGERMGRFARSVAGGELDEAVDFLAAKLAELYGADEKKGSPEKDAARRERSGIRGVIGLSPSCMVPLEDFTRMAGPGAGAYVYGGIINALFDNSVIMVAAGFWWLSERNEVRSIYTSQVSLVLGYNFILPRNFTIAPLVAGGYHFHITERDTTGVYYDPFVSVRIEGAYMVYPSLYVTVTPGYTLFFEKSNLGMYLAVEAGIKYLF